MLKENVTNARAILAMLRPDLEEAQRTVDHEVFGLEPGAGGAAPTRRSAFAAFYVVFRLF